MQSSMASIRSTAVSEVALRANQERFLQNFLTTTDFDILRWNAGEIL